MTAMDSEAKYYLRDADGSPIGPWTLEQLRQQLAEGRIQSRTMVSDGGIEWRPLAQFVASTKPASGEALLKPMEFPSRLRGPAEPMSFDWLDLNFFLGLLFVVGAGIALYYALWFDPAQAEGDTAAALNRRLCGIVGGSALVIVVMLARIYRALKSRAEQRPNPNHNEKMKTQIVSIPGAGWFVLQGTKSSKCYKTHSAAKRARTVGTKLCAGRAEARWR